MKLTVNQIILMYNIYRGMHKLDSRIGTFNADINKLGALGLLEEQDKEDILLDEYSLTARGNRLIQDIDNCIRIKLGEYYKLNR